MPMAERLKEYDAVIDKAIEHETNRINRLDFRADRAEQHDQLHEGLRLNTEYLQERPHDQRAQTRQILLLANLQMDNELLVTIEEFFQRDGYDLSVNNDSLSYSLISYDMNFIHDLTKRILARHTDDIIVTYQAHRSLLWSGDLEGARSLLNELQSSDLPQTTKILVALRQACAEQDTKLAKNLSARILTEFSDRKGPVWITHNIMGETNKAIEVLMPLDNQEGLNSITDFLAYAYFDARPFPNLMARLKGQGITPRQPREIPYRCNK